MIKKELNQEWRNVPDYPELQVRGDGKAVRSVKSLSGSAQKVQYYNYTIKQTSFGRAYIIRKPKGGEETLYVDELVASCFCPQKSGCSFVAHKDYDITNNHYDNLEWVNKNDYVSKYHLNRIKEVNGERFAWWKNNWYISEKGHMLIDGTLYANAKVYTSLYDSDLDLWRIISPYISCNGNRIFIEEGVKAVWNKEILHIDGDFNNWQETNLKIVDTDSPEAKNNDVAWENWRKQENIRLFKERHPNEPYPSFLN